VKAHIEDLWARIEAELPGISAAIVIAGDGPQGPFKPVRLRPADQPPQPDLLNAAVVAAGSGRPLLRAPGLPASGGTVAVPLAFPGAGRAAVALALATASEQQAAAALGALEKIAAELGRPPQPAPRRSASPAAAKPHDTARHALELIATALDAEHFREAATAVVTALARQHGCERVSLGVFDGHSIELSALSDSARFAERSQPLREIAAAMEEAIDQDALMYEPPDAASAELVRTAHAALRARGVGAVCTLPFVDQGEPAGAFTFEAPPGQALPAGLAERVQPVIDLVGPLLVTREREERPLARKLRDALADRIAELRDPAYPGRRLLLGSVLGTLFFLVVVPAPYRVSAPARLEGTVQRAVVAPMDGFLTESSARAGDVVEKGQMLGALDDAELALQRRKWSAQREQVAHELRGAMAEHDSARVAVLQAQLDQAEAELALAKEMLARTRLTAPFSGVVAKGDWSQELGSPVARGDVLFEIAPLDQYRIVLEVDEREVDDVALGRRGELTLSALPNRSLPLVVERIAPVASAGDARNFFRVEARLEGPTEALRPGMEGVGKIEVGWRRLLWVWTHSFTDWLRLWVWARLP
jgi:RND family efflux transporter MFP subunit